jgi:hypothetical protein
MEIRRTGSKEVYIACLSLGKTRVNCCSILARTFIDPTIVMALTCASSRLSWTVLAAPGGLLEAMRARNIRTIRALFLELEEASD